MREEGHTAARKKIPDDALGQGVLHLIVQTIMQKLVPQGQLQSLGMRQAFPTLDYIKMVRVHCMHQQPLLM
jgi:hypothetical protein